jgi:hypothetical protein
MNIGVPFLSAFTDDMLGDLVADLGICGFFSINEAMIHSWCHKGNRRGMMLH